MITSTHTVTIESQITSSKEAILSFNEEKDYIKLTVEITKPNQVKKSYSDP